MLHKIKKTETIYKKIGETPLQAIERFKVLYPKYKNEKISYAGRLDPMAEGVLLLVIGEENKNKDRYLNLEKEYTFDVLFGFETDTYDILGKVTTTSNKKVKRENIELKLENFIGELEQKYPPFSSKRVEGKALFQWMREGRINEIEIPTHKVNILEIKLIEIRKISKEDLKVNIFSKIKLVKDHDFRQDEIIKIWENILKENKEYNLTIATVKVRCSSGTYVRGIVHELGRRLGVPSTTFHILRECVGEYVIKNY